MIVSNPAVELRYTEGDRPGLLEWSAWTRDPLTIEEAKLLQRLGGKGPTAYDFWGFSTRPNSGGGGFTSTWTSSASSD